MAIVFDLDGTLTQSKQALEPGMAQLIARLIACEPVGVISGGSLKQFQKQFLPFLPKTARTNNLYIMPTSGSSMYQVSEGSAVYNPEGMRCVYAYYLTVAEKARVMDAFRKALDETDFNEVQCWGDRMEDRESQITFSALGQEAPLGEKEKWDPDKAKRLEIKRQLDFQLGDSFDVSIGGTTSIDITRKGTNKAYGVFQFARELDLRPSEITFVGDALQLGGNDCSVSDMGFNCFEVKNTRETEAFIEGYLTAFQKKI